MVLFIKYKPTNRIAHCFKCNKPLSGKLPRLFTYVYFYWLGKRDLKYICINCALRYKANIKTVEKYKQLLSKPEYVSIIIADEL